MSQNKQQDYNEISTNFIQLTYKFIPIRYATPYAHAIDFDDNWNMNIFYTLIILNMNIDLIRSLRAINKSFEMDLKCGNH